MCYGQKSNKTLMSDNGNLFSGVDVSTITMSSLGNDPLVPNCVWVMSRFQGTHTGPFAGMDATGKRVELPPTVSSLTFDAEGKVVKFTTGYSGDRTQGNSGGLSDDRGPLAARVARREGRGLGPARGRARRGFAVRGHG